MSKLKVDNLSVFDYKIEKFVYIPVILGQLHTYENYHKIKKYSNIK